MSTPRQRRIWSSRFLIASFALAAPGFVSSQATGTEIQTIAPSVVANSIHASRYGSASDCPRGFAKVAAACVAVKVPANAYLSASGDGWECARGYLRLGERCVCGRAPRPGSRPATDTRALCEQCRETSPFFGPLKPRASLRSGSLVVW